MPFKFSLALLAITVITFPGSAHQTGKTSAANDQTTAFVNVDVIPMDRERILRGQTVVVRDGRIAAN